MTKHLLLISLSIFISFTSIAQSRKDSLMSVIASEVCAQIADDKESFKTKEDITMNLGLAMMPSFAKHQAELKEFFNTDISTSEGMEKFGEEVGIKLAIGCPEFVHLFKENVSTFIDIANDRKEKNSHQTTAESISGTLVKIIPGDFTSFIIKTSNGKEIKIWWQEYFEGSEKISSANLNKPIKITFTEKDFYNSTLKDYIKQKIAIAAE